VERFTTCTWSWDRRQPRQDFASLRLGFGILSPGNCPLCPLNEGEILAKAGV
jgi:hypothetical protein